MDMLRTCVSLLLLVPVSSNGGFFTHPAICYMLDGVLLSYCIIATMLYIRVKVFSTPRENAEKPDLPTPSNPDPYQELEPLKQKKKVKKKKPQKSPVKKPQQTSSAQLTD